MTNLEVKKKVETQFLIWCEIAGLEPDSDVELCFAAGETRFIAKAYSGPQHNFIEVNLGWIIRNPHIIDEVLTHELAHIKTPGARHGPEWVSLMRKFGFPARATIPTNKKWPWEMQ